MTDFYNGLIIGIIAGAALTLFSVCCIGRAQENELIADSEYEAREENHKKEREQ